MPIHVYLADLRHDYGGVLATDCMPLGVGFIQAVIEESLPGAVVRGFAYPSALESAIKSRPPDVLMVSNYVWNEALSRRFLRMAKEANPKVLAVMGGPNIPVEPERQIEFVRTRPEIDAYVLGEGEFVARDLVQQFLDRGMSLPKLDDLDLRSAILRRTDGSFHRREIVAREADLDTIPSPWLKGLMDHYFDGRLAPIIETNRGCPFRCTFCVQGTGYYTKVNYFSLDRIKEEIAYIAKLNHERSPHMGTLRIADPNYGMFERDIEISAAIGEAQARYKWPTFIDATTGKNRPERIIASMEKVNGALVLYQAVQSLDEEVLRNIDRSNIKLDAYRQLMVHVQGRGLRSTSDLILGLPGESLESHLRGLAQLINAGTDQAHCFQAMMLKGAEMETVETRTKYAFTTRFRVLPKNHGIYGGEKVFDIEEIVVATETLPFEDYVEARRHHLAFSIYWNDSWFREVVKFATSFGIENFEWLAGVLAAMKADEGPMGRLLSEFESETRGELFETKEACEGFYGRPENLEKLRTGQIGDNLMYKYRARVSFFEWDDACSLALRATKAMIEARSPTAQTSSFQEFWRDFEAHVKAQHASGRSVEEVLSDGDVELSFDIPRWVADGMPEDLESYRFDAQRRFRYRLSQEGASELESAFKVWSARLTGLSKLVTRIRIQSQVRHPEQFVP